jgi:hypothetical protein
MIKEKKCKATGKALGFESCGTLTNVERLKYGLCPSCYPGFILNDERGKIIMQKAMNLGKQKVKKEIKKKETQEKTKAINWNEKLQTCINIIIRLIDKGLPCLARGYHPNQVHAGHVFARGGNQTMRFNLHNIHRQGAQSNHFGNDDGLLREGIKNEYGENYLEFISNLRRMPTLNYTNEDLHDFCKKASKIKLKLIKDDKYYSLDERIELRNKINLELGIYEQIFCEFDIKKN